MAAVTHRAWIDRQLGELRAQADVALADTDPEGVHQLRVAVRRIRAALKASGHDDDGVLQAELRWFFGELGPLRDLDVLLARLHHETEDFSPDELVAFERLIEGLGVEGGGARKGGRRVLRGDRYEGLRAALAAAGIAPPPVGRLTGQIARPYRKLRE